MANKLITSVGIALFYLPFMILTIMAIKVQTGDFPEHHIECRVLIYDIPCGAPGSDCDFDYYGNSWSVKMRMLIRAIMGFEAFILLAYFLAGCCSLDRRQTAMKCMGWLVMLSLAGLVVCSLAGLSITFGHEGKVCRGVLAVGTNAED